MQKIIPCLWFDDQAEEATNFYVSVFNNSKALNLTRYGDAGPRPKGMVMTTTFQLEGLKFMALNGGPEFTITPEISFFVSCKTKDEVDALWKTLSEGGMVLMELDKYPFSERFGWLQDKFGVSWQINLAGSGRKITPFLMFVGEQHGRAEEAMNFYTSVFKNSSITKIEHYRAGEGQPAGTVKHATFSLAGQEFMAIDGGREHPHTFTEALSLVVNCETQEEVDELWEKLSAGGEKGQCGWLKDRYGVSWQLVPTVLEEMLQDKDAVKTNRVMEAVLKMEKPDIAGLKQAYQKG